jgi:hypothetical protein
MVGNLHRPPAQAGQSESCSLAQNGLPGIAKMMGVQPNQHPFVRSLGKDVLSHYVIGLN